MFVQITLFFETVQQADKYADAAIGWTETFYGVDTSITSLDGWINAPILNAMIQLRRMAMSSIYRIVWMRISDTNNRGNFKVKALTQCDGRATDVPSSGVGNLYSQANCALLVDLVKLPIDPATDHAHHRKYLMRGLPADIINGNVVRTVSPQNNWQAVKNWLNWLAKRETGEAITGPPAGFPANTAVGIRFQNPANAAYSALASTGVAADKRTLSVGSALAGTVGKTKYTIIGVPQVSRQMNRTWTLRFSSLVDAAAILGTTTKDMTPTTYTAPGTGKIRVVDPVYFLFDQYTIIGLRNKKVGRIFRQLRGRSRNR